MSPPIYGSYVKWEELYDSKLPDIGLLLSKLQKYDIVDIGSFLSKLGIFLLKWPPNDSGLSLQRNILQHILTDTQLKKADVIISNTQHSEFTRTFFCRHQLLFLFRNLLHLSNHGSERISPNLLELGEILFSANDYLEPKYKIDRQNLRVMMLRTQWINQQIDLKRSLIHVWQMYADILPTISKDRYDRFIDLFVKHLQLPPTEFILIGFGLITHFSLMLSKSDSEIIQQDIRLPTTYFSKLKNDDIRQKANRILEISSYDPTVPLSFPKSSFDILNLYQKPFMEASDKSHVLIDLNCLYWKISDGIYWEIFDSEDSDNKWFMNELWGEVFHKLILEYLRDTISIENKHTKAIFIDEDPASTHRQVDFIVYINNRLFLFEISLRGLPVSTILTAEPSQILTRLDDLLLNPDPQKKHSSGKCIQFKETIQAIKDGKYDQYLPKEAKSCEFIPILVVLGNMPINIFLKELIDQVFDRKSDQKLLKEIQANLLILNPFDIDTLLWAVEAPIANFDNLLLQYKTYRFRDDFTHFVQKFWRTEIKTSSKGQKSFNDIKNKIGEFLFGEPLRSNQ